MKNIINLVDELTETEATLNETRRIANIERAKYAAPKKVRFENDHSDRNHSRRNARGEKGRQW